MPLTIRPARATDLAVIVAFNCGLALETEGKTLDPNVITPGVQAMLDDPAKGRYFLADEDGTVRGQLGVTTEWSDWRNGWFWWIQSVYVPAEHRSQGVFRRLYEYVVAAAQQEPDVIGLRLYVEEENTAAQQVYERLGMKQVAYRMLEKYPLD